MSLLNAAKIDETITTETDSVGGGGVYGKQLCTLLRSPWRTWKRKPVAPYS